MSVQVPLNIPNILSLYRLFSFPIVLGVALTGYEEIFVVLLCVNLITDILDGMIARIFKMQTEIGARLDSIADLGTYVLAILGIFLFKYDDFAPHMWSFGTFIFLFVFSYILSLLKFGRFPSLHLYSWKIGGYIQGFFFFVLFVWGFQTAFYYMMVCWGIAAFAEHIIIQLIIPQMISNARGLYWVLKN
ncbi:MAG: CDP-alcohol phosphatidyltransferase family protein [Bacteroidota bacterium]